MSKINTPITGEDKNHGVSRSEKVLRSTQEYIKAKVENGKKTYSIIVNGTTIHTTDVEKWNRYLGINQVKIR